LDSVTAVYLRSTVCFRQT